jgi:hypothetical protein
MLSAVDSPRQLQAIHFAHFIPYGAQPNCLELSPVGLDLAQISPKKWVPLLWHEPTRGRSLARLRRGGTALASA